MPRHLFFALLAVSCLCSSLSTAHAASYTFTTIDVPGSITTVADGINTAGQIVGRFRDAGLHGFLKDGATFTTIDVPGAAFTEAHGINDRGQIVGFYGDGSGRADGFLATPQVIVVTIDIKPGEFPNSINLKSKGKIPVAILTTNTFDATTVKASTIGFGNTGNEAAPIVVSVKDVNGDGRSDLLLPFNIQDTGIQCGETSASLTGETMSEEAFEGSDAIVTLGCK